MHEYDLQIKRFKALTFGHNLTKLLTAHFQLARLRTLI